MDLKLNFNCSFIVTVSSWYKKELAYPLSYQTGMLI